MSALAVSIGSLVLLSHAPGLFRLLVARASGMRVDGVVVGVLPILRRGKWAMGALPIGTFVLIAGRDATGQAADPALFRARAWPWKLLVLLGGPIAFYLFAALAMVVTYVAFGVPVEGHRPMIGALRTGKPADRAGLHLGDQIVAIDGKPMTDTYQVAPAVNEGKRTLTVEVIRDGQRLSFQVDPESDGGNRRIGIEIWAVEEFQKGAIGDALLEGTLFPVRYTAYLVREYYKMFVGKTKAEFGGPVGIVQLTRRQVSQGVRDGLGMLAIIGIYFGFWFGLLDGAKLIGFLTRRRSTVEPRDLGNLDRPRVRMPASVMATLGVLALIAIGRIVIGGIEHGEAAFLLLVLSVGVGMRHPAAWSLTRTLALFSFVGVPLFVWLSRLPARRWFGLDCPACEGQAQRVMGKPTHYGCLRCGSSWTISRS